MASIPDKLMTMIFEEGEVYGQLEDLRSPALIKSMTRKLGNPVNIIPFDKNESYLDPYRITYMYYENSRRKKAYNKRAMLKNSLPQNFRKFVRFARKKNQKHFLEDITEDFKTVLKKKGYKDAVHFWRVCRYNHFEIPDFQKKLTDIDFNAIN